MSSTSITLHSPRKISGKYKASKYLHSDLTLRKLQLQLFPKLCLRVRPHRPTGNRLKIRYRGSPGLELHNQGKRQPNQRRSPHNKKQLIRNARTASVPAPATVQPHRWTYWLRKPAARRAG
uniref:Uncharacterized protein n=1 Tax=Mycena chlorophos TaxID=658473 RepID=A0ABQ0LQH9_MYCCL|nr:predicted protein [Mycena chlorophos]